jgi:RNA polymerase sigma-70 factor (ECF subfamily)
MTDEELMARIAEGDRDAFAVLVERRRGAVMRLAFGIVRNAAEAEDIVQDCFERVWSKSRSWRSGRGGTVFGWIARIATNLAIDRKRRASPVRLDRAGDVAAGAGGAENEVTGREIGRRIRQAVALLPDRQRTAFVLCQIERMSNAAAAAALGVSVGALELLLVRARKTMRRELADLAETLS